MPQKTKEELQSEIRYAIRLCERTARFYRRIQAIGAFLALVGGSSTLSALSSHVQPWVAIVGGILLTLSGSALMVIRPADKAAVNDTDLRRYKKLYTKSNSMTLQELEIALAEARESDAPEIEVLRMVAYNDMVKEIGRLDKVQALTALQKVFSCLA
jgi:hypothetical protein